MTIIAK